MGDSIFTEGMPLPKVLQPSPDLEGVYYLQAVYSKGWVASSYFVVREAGNILISPLVYSDDLASFIEAHGGLALIFITHSDEIDAAVLSEVGRDGPGEPPARLPACAYKEQFQCRIAAHAADASVQEECEVDLAWNADQSLAPGLRFIHTPGGHTPGSACLLLETRAGRLLFCGDNLALDETGNVSTEFEEADAPSLPPFLENWSRIIEYDFDALIPLHTLAGSPSPYIAQGGQAALRTARDELAAWLNQPGLSD